MRIFEYEKDPSGLSTLKIKENGNLSLQELERRWDSEPLGQGLIIEFMDDYDQSRIAIIRLGGLIKKHFAGGKYLGLGSSHRSHSIGGLFTSIPSLTQLETIGVEGGNFSTTDSLALMGILYNLPNLKKAVFGGCTTNMSRESFEASFSLLHRKGVKGVEVGFEGGGDAAVLPGSTNASSPRPSTTIQPRAQPDLHKVLEEDFICSITQDVMTDPVMAEDGQVYDRSAIEAYFAEHYESERVRSPMGTTSELMGKKLMRVHPLRNVIEKWNSSRNSTD